jgi:hypothetical protein
MLMAIVNTYAANTIINSYAIAAQRHMALGESSKDMLMPGILIHADSLQNFTSVLCLAVPCKEKAASEPTICNDIVGANMNLTIRFRS